MGSKPDTFAEVVGKLRAHVTAHYSTKDTSTAFLTDVLEAARLLAAAGEEVRAGRARMRDLQVKTHGDVPGYPCKHPTCVLARARAALDALAPELKENDQ